MSPSVLTSSLLQAASQDTRDLKPEAPPLVSKNKYKKGDDLRFTRRTIPWIVSFEIVMEDIAYDHRL
jgi:hypothetical protein